MQHDEQSADVMERLKQNGYTVLHDQAGYIVRHQHDLNDVSRVRDLADLCDFADLIEWAIKRKSQRTQSSENE